MLVVLAQRSPDLGTDRDAAATRRVVRFDLDRHDAALPDETVGADATWQLVVVEEAAYPAVHQEEEQRPTEHERRPLHLDGDVVERQNRRDECRRGVGQEHERPTEERQLDEGEDDGDREPDPRPDLDIDAEVEHPVGEHASNLTEAGGVICSRPGVKAGAASPAPSRSPRSGARSVWTVQTDRAQTWNQTDRAQIGGRHLPTDRHGQA